MKAWITGDATITMTELPEPTAGPGQIVIAVRAAGGNRSDLFARAGIAHRGIRSSPIAGGEAAGEVVGLSDGVTRQRGQPSGVATTWRVGDRVMGMLGGALAEQAVIDERVAIAVPGGCDWARAASLPVAVCTEHDALVTNAQVQPGETVLVTGATSGVGIVACQIAHRLGARVIATTRSAERGDQLVANGWADEVVVTGDAAGPSAWPDVDVVIDHVGGALLMPSLRAMKLAGRYVSVGRLGGMTAEIDLDLVARKRLHLIGVTFRTRSIEQFAAIAAAVRRDLSDALADPTFGPPISAVFGFDQAREAQDLMAADGHFGKIVVTNP